ncbi:hypothetical protein [Noviherbaspirillum massiliense]|uniref:hypothetical protein n=1 Tax=Noviherbaspirillum massiliense TaxID=1465823 RepID=UPI000310BD5D|nr:hypothetical protein [Noviherbaspirillum massiliense]
METQLPIHKGGDEKLPGFATEHREAAGPQLSLVPAQVSVIAPPFLLKKYPDGI